MSQRKWGDNVLVAVVNRFAEIARRHGLAWVEKKVVIMRSREYSVVYFCCLKEVLLSNNGCSRGV